jgi:hypothetical protein
MGWLRRLFLDRERFWAVAAVVFTLIALRKGFHKPIAWAATQAQVDYSHGFVKRGLFGATVTRALGLQHYHRFALVSTLLLLGMLGLLAVFGKRSGMVERCGSAMPLAVFGASYTVTFLGNLNGYMDIPLAMLTVLLLMVKSVWRRALLAVPVVIAAILIHEIFLLVLLPVILLSFVLQGLYAATAGERRWAVAGAVGVALLAVGVTVVTASRASTTAQTAEAMRDEVSKRVDFKVDAKFFAVFTRSAKDNVKIMEGISKDHDWRKAQVGSVVVLLPLAGLLLVMVYRLLVLREAKEGRLGAVGGVALVACVVATLMPISMNALGWDVGRWYALAGLAGFLVFGCVCEHVAGPELDGREGFDRAAMVAIALSLAAGGFLIESSNKLYPFIGT